MASLIRTCKVIGTNGVTDPLQVSSDSAWKYSIRLAMFKLFDEIEVMIDDVIKQNKRQLTLVASCFV
ncbi:hypothetical protein [Bacillus mycoides]|uniref:hypothetical protein n=1 Tax=Bacillus mycoides TaxID=1405 RepID=UPI00077A9CFC|nr:hypothetical protein [Bacillus mycoides]KXY39797.1 hypothetical protein AT257_22040 [Bacillus cereus]QEL86291.1 hypothetical protein DN409_18695 [Bacillus mycoides]QWH02044.1 hypothetical protein EXW52_18465 [Bacillus mycoides]